MPVKKYSIELSKEERDLLNKIVEENTEPEKVIMRSKILLLSDANTNPKIMPVLDLAEYLGTTAQYYGKYENCVLGRKSG